MRWVPAELPLPLSLPLPLLFAFGSRWESCMCINCCQCEPPNERNCSHPVISYATTMIRNNIFGLMDLGLQTGANIECVIRLQHLKRMVRSIVAHTCQHKRTTNIIYIIHKKKQVHRIQRNINNLEHIMVHHGHHTCKHINWFCKLGPNLNRMPWGGQP